MDVASGAFALGGVALASAVAEVHAWREARARRDSDLTSLRREVYTNALRRLESVASRVALWAVAEPEDVAVRTAAVWEALATAYEVLNEVRLIAGDPKVAASMERTLRVYRAALEGGERVLPKVNDDRVGMIHAFREDLGISK